MGEKSIKKPESLQTIEQRIGRQQKRQVIGTTLVTILILGFAFVFFLITINQINNAQDRLLSLKAENANLESTYTELKANYSKLTQELENTRQELEMATNLARFKHEMDMAETKVISSQSPNLGALISIILYYRDQEVPWSFVNNPGRPEDGFDSPNFAGFVLQELRGVPGDGSLHDTLFSLPCNNREPILGDVIKYDGGYAMFYFRDSNNIEFVLGMTFMGIVALKVDFGAERICVLRTGIVP